MPEIQVDIKYTWNGTVWLVDLRKAAKIAVKEAITIYFNELRSILGRTWGSVQQPHISRLSRGYRAGMFTTVKRSQPGQPPFIQTQNLLNSLNVATGAKSGHLANLSDSADETSASVYTDVKYAPILEYGGVGPPYNEAELKYTSIRLTNPIRTPKFVAPRPAWMPAFELSVSRMILKIQTSLRANINWRMKP